MAISDLLNRRVRALPDEDDEAYSAGSASEGASDDGQSDPDDGSRGSLPDTDESQDELDEHELDRDDDDDDDDDDEDDDEDDSEDDSNPDDDVKASLSNISFGALAKAQASLGPKSKRNSKSTDEAPAASPLDDIRARIREAREQKRQLSSSTGGDAKKPARSSKHAPMVQSSKRAVTRKRTIIEPPAVPKARDPRFDPTVLSNSSRHNPDAANKAYAFLDDYRKSELKELKEKYAKTKNAAEKEELKRTIRSTSDRLRAIENQKREREILAEHKKKEKQLIREGKKSNPYFLKKSDLKKQVLLKKYENMNSKERTKALERRRKKVASKERKEMPMERRGFDNDAVPAHDGPGRKRRRVE